MKSYAEPSIFLATAQYLLAIGLCPVLLSGKQPIFHDYQKYISGVAGSDELALPLEKRPYRYSPGLIEEWARVYPGANVGILTRDRPTVDIDSPHIWDAIKDLLPPTPHCKRGARGFSLIYSQDRLDPVKRTRTFTDQFRKEMLVEVLADGRQTVLPPSIHPETGEAYAWLPVPWWGYLAPVPLSSAVPPALSQAVVDAIDRRLQELGLVKRRAERGVGLAYTVPVADRYRYDAFLKPKLAEKLAAVRDAQSGTCRDTLNGAVFALAPWVREGFIDEVWLEDEMRGLCEHNSWIGRDGDKAFKRQYDKALDDGWHKELPVLAERYEVTAAPTGFTMAPGASGGGTAPPADLAPLETFGLGEALAKPAQPLEWSVDGWIPHAQVSLLYGDGGAGKTTLLQQLAICLSQGAPWLGLKTRQRRVLLVSGEDEQKALVAQARPIVALLGQPGQVSCLSLVEDKASPHPFIVTAGQNGICEPTELFWRLVRAVREGGIDCLMIDPVAAVFAGNQNDPLAVYSFVNLLRRHIALELNCTVIIAAHPSQEGMRTGKGTSGSVAWNNACRSRLYLRHGEDKADKTYRVLELVKTNRGERGAEIGLRWSGGVFIHGARPSETGLRDADEVFLTTLETTFRIGQKFSPSPSTTYAPTQFAEHPNCKGYTKEELAASMQRLLEAGQICIATEGPPSKQRRYLYVPLERKIDGS